MYLGMLVIMAHDIGIIEGRKGHAENSAKLLASLTCTKHFTIR